jgi:hypothetical protein
MQEGFPYKLKITNRGTSINYGGDGRYMYVLCPKSRTVSVYDTINDIGTISGVVRTGYTSIALTFANSYHSIVYRSVALQVWAFSTADVKIIDADPTSGTFNTVIETITTTNFSPVTAVTYASENDTFYQSSSSYNAVSRILVASPTTIIYRNPLPTATNTGYFPRINSIITGGSNGECQAVSNIVNNTVHVLLAGSVTNLAHYIIKGKHYNGNLTYYGRTLDNGTAEASITLAASSQRGDVAYNPTNSRVVIGNYNSLTCVVAGIIPFASIGSVQSQLAGILASNTQAYSSITYSPYSGKIYVKSISNAGNLTGCNRVYIIDTTQALASMVCGYFTVDDSDRIIGQYNNSYMCCNQLKVNEYE